MGADALATTKQTRAALFLMCLLLCSTLPLIAPTVSADGGRDASVTITANPMALEVNPGEGGEYTIRVRNTGSNPVQVTLSQTQEGDDCSGYTSLVSQISSAIDAGAYEETTLNVTLQQTAEGSCDTVVTVNANEQVTPPDVPGQPAQESVTVTTTAGDGSGSAFFGVNVEVNANDKDQTWAGEDELDYRITIENTGRQNATINLAVDESSEAGCQGGSELVVTLSDDSVNIDSEETTTVVATVEIPEGQAAKMYCWEITGTVTSDPSGEAKDSDTFSMELPQLKRCSVTLSKTSVSVNPGAQTTITATYANEGNVDWSVTAAAKGSKAAWVTVDGASTGALPYNNGNGERDFDFNIEPDDSVRAGEETVVQIIGKEGSIEVVDCTVNLRIIVGQSYGASISLSTTRLSNIEPGTNGTTSVTITNEGNGQDNLRIATANDEGWVVQLEKSTVSVGPKQVAGEKTASVGVTIKVPESALATDEVEITFSVIPIGGGAPYDDVVLTVTVSEIHGMEVQTTTSEQTGRSGTEVRFPLKISNTGNVKDTMALIVMSQTASPAWETWFENDAGMTFSEIDINPQTSTTVYFVVSIDGEEELENTRVTIRVRNKDDTNSQDLDGDGIPDNQREAEFLAILSDRNFAMDARLDDSLSATTTSVVLPPGGQFTIGIWVKNTGDGKDDAVFTLTGLEGIATRSLTAYGLPVDGELEIPKGFGIWNISKQGFEFDSGGSVYLASTRNLAEAKQTELFGESPNYEVKEFEVFVELSIHVNPGAQTGQGGLLNFLVTSVSNAANTSGSLTITLDVSIVEELEFDENGVRQELNVTYGDTVEHTLKLYNIGNVDTEVLIFSSENLRGWSVVIEHQNGECSQESNQLTCDIKQGQFIELLIKVRPPFNAEVDDTFKFTISAEPTETGVIDRENIEFVVHGMVEDGLLGFASNDTALVIGSGLIIALLAAFILQRKK